MKPWIYKMTNTKIENLEDIPLHEHVIGFVYIITNMKTGKFYIGKKNLFTNRKTAVTKKEKIATGTRKRVKRVIKESNWKTYFGSCKELSDEVLKLGHDSYKREIIEFCCTKKYLNYCELKHQIINDVLCKHSYNGNILGKYFSKDLENC